MKSLKTIASCISVIMIAGITLNANALDQMAKEEVNPPPKEEALTTEHIAPLYSPHKTEQSLNKAPLNTAANNSLDETRLLN